MQLFQLLLTLQNDSYLLLLLLQLLLLLLPTLFNLGDDNEDEFQYEVIVDEGDCGV